MEKIYQLTETQLNNIIDIAVNRAIERLEQRWKKERFYNKKETAKLLGITPSTLSVWISQGKIPDKKLYSYQDILTISSKL
jgi:predicted transcriptional regulator